MSALERHRDEVEPERGEQAPVVAGRAVDGELEGRDQRPVVAGLIVEEGERVERLRGVRVGLRGVGAGRSRRAQLAIGGPVAHLPPGGDAFCDERLRIARLQAHRLVRVRAGEAQVRRRVVSLPFRREPQQHRPLRQRGNVAGIGGERRVE